MQILHKFSSMKQSQSEQNKSAITDHVFTSTKKITSSTGMRLRSSLVSQTRLQGGFARQSGSDRRVKVLRIETRGPTSWATSTTICCSLWRPIAEESKQQFEEDSSCCRNVTENLVSYLPSFLGMLNSIFFHNRWLLCNNQIIDDRMYGVWVEIKRSDRETVSLLCC